MSISTALVLAVLVEMATPSERTDDAWARQVAAEAAKDIERGRYDRAIDRLQRAYDEQPIVSFLFIMARIEETRGDCARAAELYERFLQSDVPAEDEREAEAGLRRCRDRLPAEPDTDAEPEVDGEPEPAPAPSPRRWYADPLGGVSTVLGLVGVGVGTGLLLQAHQDQRAAADATNLGAWDRHGRRAEQFSQAGVVTLGIGAGLLVVGIVRYAVVGARARRVRLAAGGVVVRF